MMPRTSKRPFLLKCIGLVAFVIGSLAMIVGSGLLLFRIVPLGDARIPGLEILRALGAGVSGLGIAYVIWKNKAWGRPAILAILAGSLAVEARAVSSSAFLSILPSLAVPIWYLYFWPNTVDYYRSLRQPKGTGDPGDPMDGFPVQPKEA